MLVMEGTTGSSAFSGASGNDVLVVTRHQYGDVTVNDTQGTNTVKFDLGVAIESFKETAGFGGSISSFEVSLASGAVITVSAPAQSGRYQFQFGDGAVMDYATFKTTLTAGGVASDGTLTAPYVIDYPVEVIGMTAEERNMVKEHNHNNTTYANLFKFNISVNGQFDADDFTITGDQPGWFGVYQKDGEWLLRSKANIPGRRFDHETKSSYDLNISLTTDDDETVSVDITVQVEDLYDAPPDISSVNDVTIQETHNTDAAVATFTVTPDAKFESSASADISFTIEGLAGNVFEARQTSEANGVYHFGVFLREGSEFLIDQDITNPTSSFDVEIKVRTNSLNLIDTQTLSFTVDIEDVANDPALTRPSTAPVSTNTDIPLYDVKGWFDGSNTQSKILDSDLYNHYEWDGRFSDFRVELSGIVGFSDPNGNNDITIASELHGLLVVNDIFDADGHTEDSNGKDYGYIDEYDGKSNDNPSATLPTGVTLGGATDNSVYISVEQLYNNSDAVRYHIDEPKAHDYFVRFYLFDGEEYSADYVTVQLDI